MEQDRKEMVREPEGEWDHVVEINQPVPAVTDCEDRSAARDEDAAQEAVMALAADGVGSKSCPQQ